MSVVVNSASLDKLLDQIYGAAVEFGQWPHILEYLTRELKASFCEIRVQSPETGAIDFWCCPGSPPNYQQAYREEFAGIDPILSYLATSPAGTLLNTESDSPRDRFERSEFFRQFLAPQAIAVSICGLLCKFDDRVVLFEIHFPDSPAKSETRLVRMLMPHLQRSIRINRQILQLRNRIDAANEALNRLPIGVIFLDSAGKPVLINREAEKLVLEDNGLMIGDNRFSLADRQEAGMLNQLIAEAEQSPVRKGGSLITSHSDPASSLNILVVPVNVSSDLNLGVDEGSAAIALFISRTDQQFVLPVDILKRLFGLTNAEAMVAAELANGNSTGEIARLMSLSKNTIRNHLKSCFVKTGVSRQAELVKLILSGVPALAGDETDYSF